VFYYTLEYATLIILEHRNWQLLDP